jgi:shikimate kinase
MEHLKADGIVIFLNADLDTLAALVHDFRTRGLAKRSDQSFADLFAERFPLYTKYADITINCAGLDQEEVCTRIIARIES